MSWETEKEFTENTSRFVRLIEGENRITLASDGDKVRDQYGNARVEFQTTDGKILSLRPSAILTKLAEVKKKDGSLINKTLIVVRSGMTKDDTRYTKVEVI